MVKYGIDFDISADSAVAGRADVDSGAKAAAVAASAAIRHTFIMLEGIQAPPPLSHCERSGQAPIFVPFRTRRLRRL